MKLEIEGREFEAKLEYSEGQDRLVLRTDFALLGPDAARQLTVRVLQATGIELDLLRVAGYPWLAQGRPRGV
jgi:hypothetical protein